MLHLSNLGSSYLTIIDTIEKMVIGEQEMQLSEHHLYGSSRLGIKNYLPRQVYAYWNNTDVIPVADTGSLLSRRPWYSLEYNDVINGLALSPYGSTDRTTSGSQHLAGQRQYEMTNHLGNVLATLSDLPYKSEGEVLQFRVNPALRAVYDYYPFGSLKPGRYVSDTTENCVTMTQSRWVVKYRDSTVWNPIGSGGWVSAPATTPNLGIAQQITLSSIPGDGISIEIADTAPVGGLMTAVQELAVTPNVRQDLELNLQVVSGTFVLRVLEEVNGTDVLLGSMTVSDAGGSDGTVSAPASYSISILPSTSNVRLQVSSPITMGTVLCCAPRVMNGYWKKITVPYLEQENIVVTLCDSVGDKYRFGFNGMEKDNELKGIGNSINYEARILDTRLGRFLSVDPLTFDFPWYTPYQFAGNTPIQAIDLDGAEEYHYTRTKDNSGKTILKLTHTKDLYEWKWDPNWDNKTLWTKVKNQSESHVVHQEDETAISSDGGVKWYKYDETVEFDTYEDAANSTDADFASTKQDWAYRLLQGAVNVRDEGRQGRVPRVSGYGGKSQTSASAGTYRPKQELPRNKDGTPKATSEYPHTQIGEKKGRKGNYTQAREFGNGGKVKKDIDFTDHGRSDKHPNPHQHEYKPNPSGGTPQRSKEAKPLKP